MAYCPRLLSPVTKTARIAAAAMTMNTTDISVKPLATFDVVVVVAFWSSVLVGVGIASCTVE
ncbi:MAG: hypothetical protein ACXQTR_05000 [Candidatus Methanospirareceae archaeon]